MANISLGVEVNINELLNQIGGLVGRVFYKANFSDQRVAGGRFISTMTTSGFVVAAYNHPSKFHSATADGGLLGGGVSKSTAPAGVWAVAWSSAGISGRKTYYGFS